MQSELYPLKRSESGGYLRPTVGLKITKMLFGLPRQKASKYIRSFQTWSVTQSAPNHVVPRVAVLLGVLGIAMSGYSSRQLTLNHRPSARILRSRPALAGEVMDTRCGRVSLGSDIASAPSRQDIKSN